MPARTRPRIRPDRLEPPPMELIGEDDEPQRNDILPPAVIRRGRPTLYREEYARQAKVMCTLGATDVELADFFQVSIGAINAWKGLHRSFADALKAGKEHSDDRVERSLYLRANGYTFDAEKIHVLKDGDVVRVPYREHIPPDTTAAIFWLKNRRPNQWRDVQHQAHSGHISVTVSPLEARL